MHTAWAGCSCAKIVHRKGKYVLYRGSILVMLPRTGAGKGRKLKAYGLAGARCASHT
jgi:hypothetical protein